MRRFFSYNRHAVFVLLLHAALTTNLYFHPKMSSHLRCCVSRDVKSEADRYSARSLYRLIISSEETSIFKGDRGFLTRMSLSHKRLGVVVLGVVMAGTKPPRPATARPIRELESKRKSCFFSSSLAMGWLKHSLVSILG